MGRACIGRAEYSVAHLAACVVGASWLIVARESIHELRLGVIVL